MPIRTLIVDDHAMVRIGLKSCLASYGDIAVVGEANNGAEAVRQAEACRPDVVLMDLVMPQLNGIEAIRQIKDRWPDIKVLALTSFIEAKYITEALEAGAEGYVLKDVEPPDLVAAIQKVCRGEVPLDAQAAKIVVNSLRSVAAPIRPPPATPLSDREVEVLRLAAEGKSNRDIGLALVISEKTVKAHMSSILVKLGVQNRVQAIRYGRQAGLLPL
ncbi:MAG: response regulator transcription factor [Chloroflexi bacterium]|nr:response regulator transcription factor [Chloroflexota bacterium]